MRGRGFGRGGNQNRSDLFRSRPPNTSRPPSMHVDDFDKFMAQNQQGPPILAVGMNAPRRTDVNTYVASTNVSGCICQNVCVVCNTYVVCILYVCCMYIIYVVCIVYCMYILLTYLYCRFLTSFFLSHATLGSCSSIAEQLCVKNLLKGPRLTVLGEARTHTLHFTGRAL